MAKRIAPITRYINENLVINSALSLLPNIAFIEEYENVNTIPAP
jgi:hypothetical protein